MQKQQIILVRASANLSMATHLQITKLATQYIASYTATVSDNFILISSVIAHNHWGDVSSFQQISGHTIC